MVLHRSALLAPAALALLGLAAPSRAGITGFDNGVGFTANSAVPGQPSVSGGTATITLNTGADADSLFFDTPQDITQFTADFTYQAEGNGDGFAFVLQNDARGASALGDGGGYLGYGSSGSALISPSAAVEFNLYTPYGQGTRLGTDGVTGVFGGNGGYQPTGALNLASGDAILVHLTYNGATLAESLTDPAAGTSYRTSYPVDLPTVVGGSAAFVGFTGGQASARSTQTLSDFTFTPGAPAVPEASTTASFGLLLAFGLGGLIVAARRKKTKEKAAASSS